MTRYSVDIHTADGWESIALFSDAVSVDAMSIFATAQFENGNSLTTPADAIAVIDMETGEILFDLDNDMQELLESGAHIVNDIPVYPPDWYDEPADIDDDCGFDPYEGCYTYDC